LPGQANTKGEVTLKIGVLEDDPAQAQVLCDWLEDEGHTIQCSFAGREFLTGIAENPVDLAILDWEVPDLSGIEVLRWIREKIGYGLPVLFTTQRDGEDDIVQALHDGADDYLVKPLSKPELMARIHALGRRAGLMSKSDFLELGPIKIDLNRKEVAVNGEFVKLTNKDYQLACCLLRNVGKLLSRDFLLQEVWGINPAINTRTVDMHMSRVKRSLQIGPEMGYCIKTIYQHGYRLEKIGQ
jgi:DNA-binding response OmpR family regulator